MQEKDYFSYELIHEDAQTGARAGILTTPHGKIEHQSSCLLEQILP